MNEATASAVTNAALVLAKRLCDASLATLAEGRKTFVKGKPVMVAWGPEKRASLMALQRSSFTSGPAMGLDAVIVPIVEPFLAAEGVTDDEGAAVLIDAATALYTATGLAEIDRRYGVTS